MIQPTDIFAQNDCQIKCHMTTRISVAKLVIFVVRVDHTSCSGYDHMAVVAVMQFCLALSFHCPIPLLHFAPHHLQSF
jgi:hypothetical protein